MDLKWDGRGRDEKSFAGRWGSSAVPAVPAVLGAAKMAPCCCPSAPPSMASLRLGILQAVTLGGGCCSGTGWGRIMRERKGKKKERKRDDARQRG